MKHPAPVSEHLVFDATDNGDGTGTWEAMASAIDGSPALADIQTEAQAMLRWLERQDPGPRGPQEEGGIWDATLSRHNEQGWIVVTLSFTGPWDWGEACVAQLSGEDGPGVA